MTIFEDVLILVKQKTTPNGVVFLFIIIEHLRKRLLQMVEVYILTGCENNTEKNT